jgi:outer membrane protein, multidrug efflux system
VTPCAYRRDRDNAHGSIAIRSMVAPFVLHPRYTKVIHARCGAAARDATGDRLVTHRPFDPPPAAGDAMKPRLLAALLAAILAGCTVGPDYVRPAATDVPPAWRIDYPQAAEVANTKWWQQFGDPVLDDLVETALRENLDVRVAATRIDQFAGALVATRSQFFPQIGYGADASRLRSSRLGVPAIPEPADPFFTLYQAALSTSWQIDLFGRVRRLSEAAQAQVYASEQGKRGVVLTLVTSVAAGYVTLRALDRQLDIAQGTAANFGESSRIFHLRFTRGIVSQTEVSQVDSQWQQALAAIPDISRQIAAQENLLSILLARPPGPIPRGKTIDQLVAPAIPADLPSALLERRPDILQAEQNLVAANANVGAARALYYPQLSLTGTFGSISQAFGSFLSGPATAWLVGASLAGPLVTFGGIEGQVKTAEAQKEQATLVYRQVILNALRETNDALVGSQNTREQSDRQAERVVSLREFARLSKLRFDSGLASYLEVLVAENDLFAAELAAVGTQASRYTQLIAVYQAMGGGWVDVANSMTPSAQASAH